MDFFPGLAAVFRGFDAVVDGVAHQVGEGVVQSLDDGLVQFHFLAFHGEGNFFAQTPGQVPDHPGKLVEHQAHRLHAGEHDGFLELAGDQVDFLGHVADGLGVLRPQGLEELVSAQHQFPGQDHEAVQETDVHPEARPPGPFLGQRRGGPGILVGGGGRWLYRFRKGVPPGLGIVRDFVSHLHLLRRRGVGDRLVIRPKAQFRQAAAQILGEILDKALFHGDKASNDAGIEQGREQDEPGEV